MNNLDSRFILFKIETLIKFFKFERIKIGGTKAKNSKPSNAWKDAASVVGSVITRS